MQFCKVQTLNFMFFCTELSQLEDLNTNRITRILTTDFPQYFAIVSRIRQEVHAIGPEGKSTPDWHWKTLRIEFE